MKTDGNEFIRSLYNSKSNSSGLKCLFLYFGWLCFILILSSIFWLENSILNYIISDILNKSSYKIFYSPKISKHNSNLL